MVTGSKGSLLELKKQLESVYPIKANIIRAGSAKNNQNTKSENTLTRDRDIVST